MNKGELRWWQDLIVEWNNEGAWDLHLAPPQYEPSGNTMKVIWVETYTTKGSAIRGALTLRKKLVLCRVFFFDRNGEYECIKGIIGV